MTAAWATTASISCARWRPTSAPPGAILYADNPATALVAHAQSEQVSHIVVGSSQRSRWHEALGGGSIVGRVSRLVGEAGIDVHIMALPEVDR
jgi:K+-sensing histidine kinase KdpD